MKQGWIKLYSSLIDWEWYTDIPTKVLWVHLLLTVNYEDKVWKGIPIKKGQRLTSIGHLAEETGLSVQQIRTALKHLKSTQEITIKATNKYSLITLVKWADYQGGGGKANKQVTQSATNEQQATNKQLTTTKEYKNIRNKDIYKGLSSELVDALEEFAKMRKQIKAPMTDRAMSNLISKLRKMADINSPIAIAIVEQSIDNCWKGIYELKQETYERIVADDTKVKLEKQIAELKQRLADKKEELRICNDKFAQNNNQDNFRNLSAVRTEVARLEDAIKQKEKQYDSRTVCS